MSIQVTKKVFESSGEDDSLKMVVVKYDPKKWKKEIGAKTGARLKGVLTKIFGFPEEYLDGSDSSDFNWGLLSIETDMGDGEDLILTELILEEDDIKLCKFLNAIGAYEIDDDDGMLVGGKIRADRDGTQYNPVLNTNQVVSSSDMPDPITVNISKVNIVIDFIVEGDDEYDVRLSANGRNFNGVIPLDSVKDVGTVTTLILDAIPKLFDISLEYQEGDYKAILNKDSINILKKSVLSYRLYDKKKNKVQDLPISDLSSPGIGKIIADNVKTAVELLSGKKSKTGITNKEVTPTITGKKVVTATNADDMTKVNKQKITSVNISRKKADILQGGAIQPKLKLLEKISVELEDLYKIPDDVYGVQSKCTIDPNQNSILSIDVTVTELVPEKDLFDIPKKEVREYLESLGITLKKLFKGDVEQVGKGVDNDGCAYVIFRVADTTTLSKVINSLKLDESFNVDALTNLQAVSEEVVSVDGNDVDMELIKSLFYGEIADKISSFDIAESEEDSTIYEVFMTFDNEVTTADVAQYDIDLFEDEDGTLCGLSVLMKDDIIELI